MREGIVEKQRRDFRKKRGGRIGEKKEGGAREDRQEENVQGPRFDLLRLICLRICAILIFLFLCLWFYLKAI